MADADLIRHLVSTTGLSDSEAHRVIDDVVAWYREPVEVYVRRRHSQLKSRGAKNADIYPQLVAELSDRVVSAPDLSERQIRRLIYT